MLKPKKRFVGGVWIFSAKTELTSLIESSKFYQKKRLQFELLFFKMAVMYHGRVDILDSDATFSHLRSHGHIPSRFNRAAWDRLAIKTANLNSTGNVTTIFGRRFVIFHGNDWGT